MAKLHEYQVTLPIAGHAYLTVEAESEEAAIEIAFNEVTIDNIEAWEAVPQFHEGNVCYCPRPWEAEAQDCGLIEDDADPSNCSETEGKS